MQKKFVVVVSAGQIRSDYTRRMPATEALHTWPVRIEGDDLPIGVDG